MEKPDTWHKGDNYTSSFSFHVIKRKWHCLQQVQHLLVVVVVAHQSPLHQDHQEEPQVDKESQQPQVVVVQERQLGAVLACGDSTQRTLQESKLAQFPFWL